LQFRGIASNIKYAVSLVDMDSMRILSNYRRILLAFTSIPHRNRVIRYVSTVVFVLALSAPSQGQPRDGQAAYHPVTIYGGGGAGVLTGTEANSFHNPWGFQFGGGKAITSRPKQEYDQNSNPVQVRRWNIYLTINFNYQRSSIDSLALQQAILLNPQNTALLSAKSGKVKFYSTTLDPSYRFQITPRLGWYASGGFGWLRRTLEFDGIGNLLQPATPSLFAPHGNSGVVDGGTGLDIGVSQGRGLKAYFEFRVLHGLAANSESTLIPLSAGLRW